MQENFEKLKIFIYKSYLPTKNEHDAALKYACDNF